VTNSSFAAIASAELYDPTLGTFSLTGNMTTPRGGHTAILLPDGRVLIAGGSSGPVENVPYLATAEIYDPSTGTFTDTSDMVYGNACAQALVLNNGKVLLFGGSPGLNGNPPTPGAQLYDPTTGSFADAGTYATVPPNGTFCGGRASTLLADGRVLIVWEDDLAEIYNPETGSFTQTGKPLGPSPYNLGFATATLLMDGNVLVTGGEDVNQLSYKLTELFDSFTGSFTPGGILPSGHDGASANLLPNGTVLIAGGDYDWGVPYSPQGHAVLYYPVSGIYSVGPEMVTSREIHTATLLNDGRVLIAGGFAAPASPPSAISLAELYTPDVLTPAPVLLSVTGDAQGQGAILHAGTARLVTARDPAVAGEALEIFGMGLIDGSVIPPQVAIGGRIAEVLYFGKAPGYAGLNQINVSVPSGLAAGSSVPVRLNYLGRPSNGVTISVQ